MIQVFPTCLAPIKIIGLRSSLFFHSLSFLIANLYIFSDLDFIKLYIFSYTKPVKVNTFSDLGYKLQIIFRLKIQSKREISSLKPLFTYNISFSVYALLKVNMANNCRRKFNYSFAFKLETISIVLIFLANNLFITYETRTVPMIAYT